ncbi:MAG: ABC transporter permease [Gemmatimonadaceae bacterium]|nr:ABC transporter permease [Gemmatimonadaceae bacterium]
MRDVVADLRFAARQLIKHPVFALSVLLSLALGIGVNTTVFSIASAILLRAPQAVNASELVRVYVNHHSPFTWPDYQRLKEDGRAFSRVIAETVQPVSIMTNGEPEQVTAALVSADYFAALGLQPATGRFPRIDREDRPSAVPEVVLSHRYWTRRFAADAAMIGRTVRLNDRAFRVSGVAPIGFTTAQVLWAPDVYVPLSETPTLLGKGPEVLGGGLYLTVRLASGVSRDAANARVAVLFAQVASQDSARLARQSWRVDAAVGVNAELRGPVSAASAFLLVIAIAVLLVACFNVGNLILARNAARSRELAVRVALGATRRRVIQQLLVELSLISLLGAILALLATRWSTALLVSFIPADASIHLDTGANGIVVVFTLILVAMVVAVAGLAPALQSTRVDLTAGLRDGAVGGGRRRTRLRRAFLGLQVTASTVLVACAGLFLHSLRNADDIDAGFNARDILNAPIELGRGRDAASSITVVEQLEARLRESPGVTAVTAATVAPLTGSNAETSIQRDGDDAGARHHTYYVAITPDYFATMRMPLTAGREFASSDRAGAPGVAIVNETFAKQLFPGQSPLGKRIRLDGDHEPWLEIVGVSRPIRYNSLGETPPVFLYVPFAQQADHGLNLHGVLAPGASVPGVSRRIVEALRAIDPAVPPPTVRRLTDAQRIVLLPAQLGAALTGVFGGLALLLAAVGIFGVAAFDVSQRTRELGIRSALGAPAAAILRVVLSDTVRTVLVAGAVGVTLAMALGRVLSSQLYGVSAFDPVTFVATPLLLALVAAVAALVPARRALRVDPAVALREG